MIPYWVEIIYFEEKNICLILPKFAKFACILPEFQAFQNSGGGGGRGLQWPPASSAYGYFYSPLTVVDLQTNYKDSKSQHFNLV